MGWFNFHMRLYVTSKWRQGLFYGVKASEVCHCYSTPESFLAQLLVVQRAPAMREVKPPVSLVEHFRNVVRCHFLHCEYTQPFTTLNMCTVQRNVWNYNNRALMVCCNLECISATCHRQIEREIVNKATCPPLQLWYPLTLGRDPPHPVFSEAFRLQYHNSPSLTFLRLFVYASLFSHLSILPSHLFFLVLCVSLFHSVSLTWTVSLSEPLALSRQTSHPSAPTDREERGKKREQLEKGRIVCQCHPFLLLFGKYKWFYFEFSSCFGVDETTLFGVNGPWKK